MPTIRTTTRAMADAAADVTTRIEPATPQRRDDIAAVMNDCGDARGCWCAFWSRPRQDFKVGWGQGNKRWFFARLEAAPVPPGVLAYVGDEPVGWCAVAPRSDHSRLARSRNLRAVDAEPVWAITCLVVVKRFRRQGLSQQLIAGAVDHARIQGAQWIEAYPLDAARKLGSGELFTGPLASYSALGFTEVARHAPTRPILRLAVKP